MKKHGFILLMVVCLLVTSQVSAGVLGVSELPEVVLINGYTAETKIANQDVQEAVTLVGVVQAEDIIFERPTFIISLAISLVVIAAIVLMRRKIEEGFLLFAEFT